MNQAAPVNEDDILWDVAAEHLAEGGFAFTCWQVASASPLYTLDETARGPEERLLSHLDALVIHGPLVAERLLEPELAAPESPDFERSAAAAMALLRAGRWEAAWSALSSNEAQVRDGAREGLLLDAPPEVDRWLIERLGAGRAELSRSAWTAALEVATRRGLTAPTTLDVSECEEPLETAAALALARTGGPSRHLAAVERLVDSEESCVADAALVTGLCFGSAHAWRWCLALAADRSSPHPLAMQLIAMLGTRADHEVLVEHLDLPSHRAAALAALAWTGQAALVPALLPFLASADASTAKRASLAFAAITGVDTRVRPYAATGHPHVDDDASPEAVDDLDAELVPAIDESFPAPDPEAIGDFWRRIGRTFDARHRLLMGEPWTLARCLDQLERASNHDRRAMALWLQIRSGGAAQVSVEAWSDVQRAQQARLRKLDERSLIRRFGDW